MNGKSVCLCVKEGASDGIWSHSYQSLLDQMIEREMFPAKKREMAGGSLLSDSLVTVLFPLNPFCGSDLRKRKEKGNER